MHDWWQVEMELTSKNFHDRRTGRSRSLLVEGCIDFCNLFNDSDICCISFADYIEIFVSPLYRDDMFPTHSKPNSIKLRLDVPSARANAETP